MNETDIPQETLEHIRQQVRQNIAKVAESRESHYNKNHKLVQFEIGDLVKTFTKSDADKKLTKKFM